MSIDIGVVVRRGYERTVARNGLLFAAILYVLSLLDAMFSTGMAQQTMPVGEMGAPVSDVVGGGPPVSLGLSPVVAGVLSLLLGLVSVVVIIGAIRTFVSDETETLPREHFTEDIPWTAVNLIVGSILFGIGVTVGFVLLVIPGLFLLVSLFFWEVFVAVEGDNLVEGFRHSWDLTSGRRLRLFLLGIVVFAVALVVSIVFSIPSAVLPDVVGFLIEQVGSALVGVFILAAVAETYNQLVATTNEDGTEPVVE